MEAQIIRIGNSKGLRIPSTILKQCKIKNTVNLEVENDRLIITSNNEPRLGWERYFRFMAKNADDQLIDGGSLSNSWDDEEW